MIEQAAIAGVLRPEITGDAKVAKRAADYIAKRLDALADETERGWAGSFDEATGFSFERTVRGVKDGRDHRPGAARLGRCAQARRLMRPTLQRLFPKPTPPAMLRRKDENTGRSTARSSLFEAVTGAGRKGITLQRYKGLGEMNPEQLWETTLDTNARSLLQVKVKEVDEADDIFDQADGRRRRAAPRVHQDNALTASVDV